MYAPADWLVAFLLTVAIEAPIVVFAMSSRGVGGVGDASIGISLSRSALIAVFAQLVTHPLVWFVFPRISGITGYTATTLSELWAWLGEALFYATVIPRLGWARAIGISGVANGLSFAIGLFLSSR